MRGNLRMTRRQHSQLGQWVDTIPVLTNDRARHTAQTLIADYGLDAESEAQDRLSMMHALGCVHGILNWQLVISELPTLRRKSSSKAWGRDMRRTQIH